MGFSTYIDIPCYDMIKNKSTNYRSDSTRSKQKIFPGFLEVDDVHLLHNSYVSDTAKIQQGQRFSERKKLLTPSVFFFQTYCSMVVSLLSEPMCVVAANILVTSSSVKARADMPADILGSEAKYMEIFINLAGTE